MDPSQLAMLMQYGQQGGMFGGQPQLPAMGQQQQPQLPPMGGQQHHGGFNPLTLLSPMGGLMMSNPKLGLGMMSPAFGLANLLGAFK